MISQTLELVQRVKWITGRKDDWFDTVCRWYQNARLSVRLIEEFLARDNVYDLVSLTVNDRALAVAAAVRREARQISWLIPGGVR